MEIRLSFQKELKKLQYNVFISFKNRWFSNKFWACRFLIAESVLHRVLEHRQVVEQPQDPASLGQLWRENDQRLLHAFHVGRTQDRRKNDSESIRRSDQERSVTQKSDYFVAAVVSRQPFDQSVRKCRTFNVFRHFGIQALNRNVFTVRKEIFIISLLFCQQKIRLCSIELDWDFAKENKQNIFYQKIYS
jgi:hypothetical protein